MLTWTVLRRAAAVAAATIFVVNIGGVGLIATAEAAPADTATADTPEADATPFTLLVYGPTSGGSVNTTPGATVTVWDEATWSSKSTEDFAQFDAIAFGDWSGCSQDPQQWATAVANRQVWSRAITGNVIVLGTDPDDGHGKTQLVQQGVQFAAADTDPGSMSNCYWASANSRCRACRTVPTMLWCRRHHPLPSARRSVSRNVQR